jgi:maltodextrin utilization protein YvdJ
MAKGMNLGILSLLAVIGVVLGGVASFFVYLGKRSATVSVVSAAAQSMESTERA